MKGSVALQHNLILLPLVPGSMIPFQNPNIKGTARQRHLPHLDEAPTFSRRLVFLSWCCSLGLLWQLRKLNIRPANVVDGCEPNHERLAPFIITTNASALCVGLYYFSIVIFPRNIEEFDHGEVGRCCLLTTVVIIQQKIVLWQKSMKKPHRTTFHCAMMTRGSIVGMLVVA